jgi:hypothetical protein
MRLADALLWSCVPGALVWWLAVELATALVLLPLDVLAALEDTHGASYPVVLYDAEVSRG